MATYSILYICPDSTRAPLVDELRHETGFDWTVVEAPCRPEAGAWPPARTLVGSTDYDAVVIQAPDPCPLSDFAGVVLELTRVHPDLLLYLLVDSARAELVRALSDVCSCGLLFPGLMTAPHIASRLRDGIDHRRLERDLREANTFASQVIGSAGEGIVVMDEAGKVRIWNSAMERQTGVAAPFALGRDARELLPTLADRDLENAVQRALWGETDPAVDVHYCNRRTGRTGWLSAVFAAHRDADGRIAGVIGMVRDVSERKEAELALRHLAFHDPLTGLPNRRFFRERLEEAVANACRYGHRFALMAIDLDRFKEINDTWGHEAGDDLLRLFVERVGAQLRKGDVFARQGGDEFVVLLPEVASGEDVEPVAAKIVAALREPFRIGDEPIRMTASIGYVLHDGDEVGPDELFRRADRAMYRAKDEGRNRYRRHAR